MPATEPATYSERNVENTLAEAIFIGTRNSCANARMHNADRKESMHCFKFFESTSTRPRKDRIMSVLNSKSLPPWRKRSQVQRCCVTGIVIRDIAVNIRRARAIHTKTLDVHAQALRSGRWFILGMLSNRSLALNGLSIYSESFG
jgi:hypothetical protein